MKQKRVFLFLVKLLILLVIVGYIFYVFLYNIHLTQEMNELFQKTWGQPSFYWIVPILLIFVNWGFEAQKWKYLIQKIEKVSFWEAYEGVLTGLSFGFVTPRSIGDYAGRVLQLKASRRSEVVGALVVSRFAQLVATLFFGALGFIVFSCSFSLNELWTEWSYLVSFALIVLFLLTTYWNRNYLFTYLQKLKLPFIRFLLIIKSYTLEDYRKVLSYSFLRYLTFSTQFIVVMYLYGVSAPILLLFCAIALIYLTKSLVISFNFLSDLGVREASAIFFLSKLGISPSLILISSLSLWLLNIVVPTVVGAFFVLKLKFFPDDNT
ncbi:MAG: flippase-like domain-containing protein [Cytophagales bacterium]|nr:flippase-like domain-containing protein [Cytophagales bacterium]